MFDPSSKARCTSCGESFAAANSLGEPRTRCPICKAELETPRVEDRETIDQEDPGRPFAESASTIPEPPVIENGVAKPGRVAPLEKPRAAFQSTACPRGTGCDAVECRRAFQCGALEHPEASYRKAWFWSFVIGGITAVIIWGSMIALEAAHDGLNLSTWFYVLIMYVAPAGVFVLVLGFWLCGISGSRIEARIIARGGTRLGLHWAGFEPIDTGEITDHYMIAYPGQPRRFYRLLRGDVDRIPIEVIEFHHQVSERDTRTPTSLAVAREAIGKNLSIEHIRWAVCFPERIADLPDFNLTPVGDLDYFFDRYAPQDRALWVANDWERQFTEMYYLGAIRSEMVRPKLSPAVVRYLVEKPYWNIQSRQGRLTLWRVAPPQKDVQFQVYCKPLTVKEIPDTVEDALQLRHLLVKARAVKEPGTPSASTRSSSD